MFSRKLILRMRQQMGSIPARRGTVVDGRWYYFTIATASTTQFARETHNQYYSINTKVPLAELGCRAIIGAKLFSKGEKKC